MEIRIYKKDSAGNIRFLSISTEGNLIVQESGIVGTKNSVTNKSVCIGKNIGKTNETTPEEQAISEANSKVTEKLRLGYFHSIEEAQEKGGADFMLPMLAKDYKKEAKKVVFPCYGQPKLDGMRALGECNSLSSRTGKEIATLSHIDISEFEDVILDGELYAHGLSFQDNMKIIKKYVPGKSVLVKYHVYDVVMDAPFSERYLTLAKLVGGLEHVELVHCQRIHSEEELITVHQQYLSLGYEGTMIRHSEQGYQVNMRSSQLLKYKDFLDETYEVIDVLPSESRPEQGIVVCTSEYGSFSCGMKFPHEAREEILRNKHMYIGQTAEVRFFEFTDSGLPRFPICYGFRFDK